MKEILKISDQDGRVTTSQIATMVDKPAKEVRKTIQLGSLRKMALY
ncbi:MAG: hypothetical protein ACXQTH_02590 [Dehalococcoidia bacterium]